MQISDDLYLGTAFIGGSNISGGPSPQELGVGPMGRMYGYDILPLTLQVAGLSVSATPAGAGNLVLAAGTGVTTVVDSTNVTRYVLDVPRCVTVTAAGINTAVFTISGYDVYGQFMTQLITAPSTSTVATNKAFKSVTQIAISAAAGSAITAGFNDKFGLPVRVTNATYVISAKWDAVLAADTGTFVASDQTSPATASTTDVRGSYTPSTASNGIRRLLFTVFIPALGSGPNATRIGAVGVNQA